MDHQSGAAVPGDQVGKHVQRRAGLVVPVRRALHDLRVRAEGGVVDERATADHSQVDPQLQPVGQAVEAFGRVVAIEPEVQREVVAGARADDQERQVVLGRDAGDERLGAVPAGNAQQVGAAGHRVPGEGGDVDDARAIQERHLGTHGLGLLLEPELRHLPPARPRVHHQERMLHWAGRIGGHALVPGDDTQRRSAGHAREHGKGE